MGGEKGSEGNAAVRRGHAQSAKGVEEWWRHVDGCCMQGGGRVKFVCVLRCWWVGGGGGGVVVGVCTGEKVCDGMWLRMGSAFGRRGGVPVCVCECGTRPAACGRRSPGPKNHIDLNFGRRVRAGGGGGRDPVWVTPAAFALTAPHTHIAADASVCSEKMRKKMKRKLK